MKVLDVLGYSYDDSTYAFMLGVAGDMYIHLATGQSHVRDEFDEMLKDNNLAFKQGEVSPEAHIIQPHRHDGKDGSGTVSHADLDSTPNDHHPQLHSLIDPQNHQFPASPEGKYLKDNGTWADITPAGAIETPLNFSTAIIGNPASGVVATNNVDQTLATEVHISYNNSNGNDISPFITGLDVGDVIGLIESVGSGTVWYNVIATAIDQGTWSIIGVSLNSGAGGILDAAAVSFGIIGNPDNKLPSGGVRPQVLKKNTSGNYDSVWEDVAHSDLTDVNPDDHHPKAHLLYGGDHTDVSLATPPEVGSVLVFSDADPLKPWEALDIFGVSGYGGINLLVPASLPDIGGGWTTLPADNNILVTPRNVTQDAANNGLIILAPGVYIVNLGVTLEHNEVNGSRVFDIRLYDFTNAVGGRSTSIGIGRNQSMSNYSASVLFEVGPGEIGDLFQIQIGNGDTLSSVTLHNFFYNVNLISEYRGTA